MAWELAMTELNKNFPLLFRQNFASGLVVFLVALPLCLGISLASGAPPLSGIISGIIGGIVVGYLSTSHLSVAGPAAGLTAIVAASIQELGSFELFLCAGLLAGVLQFCLGYIRAGSIADYIPTAVIEGMLAGIGILIILKELPYAFGGGVFHFSVKDFEFTLSVSLHFGAILIAAISLALIISWEHIPVVKKLKWLPSALVAVLLGIFLNYLFSKTDASFISLTKEQLVQLPVTNDISELIRLPDMQGFLTMNVWQTAITIAVVASIESLLSLEATDRLDKHRRISDSNQELRAQGAGNFVSSLLGGLPVTAVILRSSVNVSSGATHKLSAIIHGILLFVCVLSIPLLLNQIPLASLAAVLIVVGYRLARPKLFKKFWKKGIYQFVPFMATLLGVVIFDLMLGVAIGLLCSIGFILHDNMKRSYYLSREELATANQVTLQLSEEVSFLNKAAIKKTLKNVQPNSTITFDATRTIYIADDVLELIEDFTNVFAKENNITVIRKGFKSGQDKNPNALVSVDAKNDA